MNYLGIDYGEKRIGLSFADELKVAVPLPAATQSKIAERLKYIAQVVHDRKVGEIVIGYPFNMDGTIGFKAKEVDVFIEKLLKVCPLPIHKVDERLTSKSAEEGLKPAKSIKAKQKQRRSGELDSKAATLILSDFLSTEGM